MDRWIDNGQKKGQKDYGKIIEIWIDGQKDRNMDRWIERWLDGQKDDRN